MSICQSTPTTWSSLFFRTFTARLLSGKEKQQESKISPLIISEELITVARRYSQPFGFLLNGSGEKITSFLQNPNEQNGNFEQT